MGNSMVNNAGISIQIGGPLPIHDTADSTLDTTMFVNSRGVFLGVKSPSSIEKVPTSNINSQNVQQCLHHCITSSLTILSDGRAPINSLDDLVINLLRPGHRVLEALPFL